MKHWITLLVVFCSFIGAVGQILFKKGMDNFEFKFPFLNFILLIGLSCYCVALIGYLFALRFGQVSIIYPIIALSYVFVVLLAWKFLGEPITTKKMIGTIGIIACVWLITI